LNYARKYLISFFFQILFGLRSLPNPCQLSLSRGLRGLIALGCHVSNRCSERHHLLNSLTFGSSTRPATEPQKRLLVLAHDGSGVESADEVMT